MNLKITLIRLIILTQCFIPYSMCIFWLSVWNCREGAKLFKGYLLVFHYRLYLVSLLKDFPLIILIFLSPPPPFRPSRQKPTFVFSNQENTNDRNGVCARAPRRNKAVQLQASIHVNRQGKRTGAQNFFALKTFLILIQNRGRLYQLPCY